MKKISRSYLILALALFALCGVVRAESWLEIIKSQNGFLFNGLGKGETFSFDVVGTTIKTRADGDRAFAKVDDVLIQVFKAKSAAKVKNNPLAAYKKSEMAYQQTIGMETSLSNHCVELSLPHEEWTSTITEKSRTVTLIFKLKKSILIIAVASEVSLPEDRFLEKVKSICSSYGA
jgi:hypothetical protein